jgi:hypothetical protein
MPHRFALGERLIFAKKLIVPHRHSSESSLLSGKNEATGKMRNPRLNAKKFPRKFNTTSRHPSFRSLLSGTPFASHGKSKRHGALTLCECKKDSQNNTISGDVYIPSPSSQRKLGSSVFLTSKALDPSFRWDDEQKKRGDIGLHELAQKTCRTVVSFRWDDVRFSCALKAVRNFSRTAVSFR